MADPQFLLTKLHEAFYDSPRKMRIAPEQAMADFLDEHANSQEELDAVYHTRSPFEPPLGALWNAALAAKELALSRSTPTGAHGVNSTPEWYPSVAECPLAIAPRLVTTREHSRELSEQSASSEGGVDEEHEQGRKYRPPTNEEDALGEEEGEDGEGGWDSLGVTSEGNRSIAPMAPPLVNIPIKNTTPAHIPIKMPTMVDIKVKLPTPISIATKPTPAGGEFLWRQVNPPPDLKIPRKRRRNVSTVSADNDASQTTSQTTKKPHVHSDWGDALPVEYRCKQCEHNERDCHPFIANARQCQGCYENPESKYGGGLGSCSFKARLANPALTFAHEQIKELERENGLLKEEVVGLRRLLEPVKK